MQTNIPATAHVWQGILLGLLAALLWGIWPVASKMGMQSTLSAMDITALRFGISGLILLPILIRMGFGQIAWGKALVLAMGAGVPYVLLGLYGLHYAPAGHFGLFGPSTMIVLTYLLSWKLLKEPLGHYQVVGISLILSGLFVVSINNIESIDSQSWIGDLMFMGCGVCWSSYSVLCKKWQISSWQSVSQVSVISMILFLPVYFIFFDNNLLITNTTELFWQGLLHGVLIAIVALVCYTRAIAILGSGRGAVFASLVPCVALLLAIPLLNEWPTIYETIGLLLVTLGMLWALGFIKSLRSGFGRKVSKVA